MRKGRRILAWIMSFILTVAMLPDSTLSALAYDIPEEVGSETDENGDPSPVGGSEAETTVKRVLYHNHISKAAAEIDFMFNGGNILYLDPMIGKKKGGYEYDLDTQDPKNLPEGWSLKKNPDGSYTLTADPLRFTMTQGEKPAVGEEIWVGVAVEGSNGYGEDQLKLIVPEEGKSVEVKTGEVTCTHKNYPEKLVDKKDGKQHDVVCSNCNTVLRTEAHKIKGTPVANSDGKYEGKYIGECACGYHEEGWCKHDGDAKFLYKDNGDGTHNEYCSRCGFVKGWDYHSRKYESVGNGKRKVTCGECDYSQTVDCRHPFTQLVPVGCNKHARKCKECNEILEETKEDCIFSSREAKPFDGMPSQHVAPCIEECGNLEYEDHNNDRKLYIMMYSPYLGSYTIRFEDKCRTCGAKTTGQFYYEFPRKLLFMFNNLDKDLKEVIKKTQGNPNELIYLKNKFPNDENKDALIGKYALQGLGLGGAFKSLDGALLDYSTLLYEQGSTKDLKVMDKDGNTIYNGKEDKPINPYGLDGETLMQIQGEEQGQEIETVDIKGYDEVYVALNTNMLYGLEDGDHTLTVLLTDDEGNRIASTMVFTIGSETEDGVTYKMVTSLYPLDTAADAENNIVDFRLDRTEIPWTGKAMELPAASLKKGDTDLVSGTDYTLSYYRISYDNDGKRMETPVEPGNITEVGTYMVKATAAGDAWTVGEPSATFRVAYDLSECGTIASVKDQNYTSLEVEPGVNVYATVNGEERKLTRSGAFTYSEGDKTFTQGDPADYTVSYSNNTERGTAIVTVTGDGDYMGTLTQTFEIVEHTVADPVSAPESWNLFEDVSGHTYTVSGVSAAADVANSNSASSKFFTATLSGDVITVKLKDGADRKKAAAANVLDFDLGEAGTASYTLPLSYNKPVLKLSGTKGTVKKGKETVLTTTVLVKTGNGNFVAYDLDGATVTYGTNTVTLGENGLVEISASGKASEKLKISREGWNTSDPVELKYTITEVKEDKDVLDLKQGGSKQLVLNSNAPAQSIDFPLTLNGEPATADTIKIEVNKAEAESLVSLGDGVLNVSLGESGIKKGSYTFTLTSTTDSKAKVKLKVRVSDKALAEAAGGKVKQKLDVVTDQPMIVEPKLKEVNGTIEAVNVAVVSSGAEYTDFEAEMDGESIKVVYTGSKPLDAKKLKLGDMKFTLTVEGITEPVEFTLKNVSAKKTTPKVKASKLTIPKTAAESADGTTVIGVVNILSSYKDAAKHVRILTPVKVEPEGKGVTAEADEADPERILIKKLDGKSGSVKVKLTYVGGMTKTVVIKVKKGK